MRVGGQWIGWGLGDSDPEVRKLKAYMRKKFSYARDLADTNLYDQQMVKAVTEMQARYNTGFGQLATGKYTPGVINFETKVVMGYVPRPPKLDQRPMLFSVCGTGVPWWVGPDADTAKAVEAQYKWQPTGYPAQAIPMGPSIDAGKAELENQINIHRDQVMRCGAALLGYSQGAICVSELYMEQIEPENGRLHWMLPKLLKVCTWGNPCRQKNIVWPDAGAPSAPVNTQGVADNRMTRTPSFWREYAHLGDLYACSPDDESGENRNAIWQIIRNGDMMTGPNSLLRQVMELTGISRDADAISETTGMVKAMLDALVFFGKQTQPHTNYDITPAVQYLRG